MQHDKINGRNIFSAWLSGYKNNRQNQVYDKCWSLCWIDDTTTNQPDPILNRAAWDQHAIGWFAFSQRIHCQIHCHNSTRILPIYRIPPIRHCMGSCIMQTAVVSVRIIMGHMVFILPWTPQHRWTCPPWGVDDKYHKAVSPIGHPPVGKDSILGNNKNGNENRNGKIYVESNKVQDTEPLNERHNGQQDNAMTYAQILMKSEVNK